MGNTESVVVEKRLARFRPEERPLIEGAFDRLQGDGASGGKVLTLERFKVRIERHKNKIGLCLRSTPIFFLNPIFVVPNSPPWITWPQTP